MSTTGQRLKELRKKRGFTQRYVAEICNIKRTSYTSYEHDMAKPSIQVLVLLAKLFNVSMEYLACTDNEKGTSNSLALAEDRYSDISLIDINTLSHLRTIKTPIEKLFKGKYIYCYSPIQSLENRIKKTDLLLIQQNMPPQTGDILLIKKDEEFIIGCALKNNSELLLFNNNNFSAKFITLNKTYEIIGIIKEVTIRMRK